MFEIKEKNSETISINWIINVVAFGAIDTDAIYLMSYMIDVTLRFCPMYLFFYSITTVPNSLFHDSNITFECNQRILISFLIIRFLFALGIRHVGQESATDIAAAFGTFSELWDYLKIENSRALEMEKELKLMNTSSSISIGPDVPSDQMTLLLPNEDHSVSETSTPLKKQKRKKTLKLKNLLPTKQFSLLVTTPTSSDTIFPSQQNLNEEIIPSTSDPVNPPVIGSRILAINGLADKVLSTLLELVRNPLNVKMVENLLKELQVLPYGKIKPRVITDTNIVAISNKANEENENMSILSVSSMLPTDSRSNDTKNDMLQSDLEVLDMKKDMNKDMKEVDGLSRLAISPEEFISVPLLEREVDDKSPLSPLSKSPILGKVIVFTGTLSTMSRDDAFSRCRALGTCWCNTKRY